MARSGREATVGEAGPDEVEIGTAGAKAVGTDIAGRGSAGRRHTPVALTIAGSDSGGGAGIQADLKAFARCGVHGCSAITAITAQSTVGVRAIHAVAPEMVLAQVQAVVEDIGVDAVKVGMLGTVEVTLAVARALDELPAGTPVVVDPVMVAESGARLLDKDAQEALIAEILPRASVLTPNLPEARMLAGFPARAGDATVEEEEATTDEGERDRDSEEAEAAVAATNEGARERDNEEEEAVEQDREDEEARELARTVLALGPGAVVLTGGHRARAVDLLLERAESGASSEAPAIEIAGERYPDGAAHGSGCTHSALLAARLALGDTLLEAATLARRLAGEAVAGGLRDVGSGAGPVDVLGLKRMREG
jgi:hydroxymethylpyrimidine/phosphomethylpyrimidine kinase